MRISYNLKIIGLSLALCAVQACASAPDTPQKSDKHIKTEVPPPFPITPESLHQEREKEREAEARKKAAQ